MNHALLKKWVFLFLLPYSNFLFGQINLCPDPSFECFEIHQVIVPPFQDLIASNKECRWMSYYSADIYSHQPVPSANSWKDNNRIARTGHNHAGLYNWGQLRNFPSQELLDISSHERLLIYLPEQLEAGAEYFIQFYFKPSLYPVFDSYDQLYHSPNVSLSFFSGTYDEYTLAAQNAAWGMPEVRVGAQNSSYPNGVLQFDHWQVVEACYTATGEEQLIVLGNHLPHIDSDFILSDATVLLSPNSYVLIDDVFIGKKPDLTVQDTTICEGDEYVLTLPVDSLLEVELYHAGSPIADLTVRESGKYEFIGNYGPCQVYEAFTVQQQACSDCNIYIPNVFSPNADGINDQLTIHSKCNVNVIDFKVFDRWGNQLFNDQQNPMNHHLWDGRTSNDQEVATGVYIYYIHYQVDQINQLSSIQSIVGDVTIVR